MTEQGESRNVVNGGQQELAEVRPGRWMVPHAGGTPPAMDAETLATAVHRAGLERMLAHDAPPAVQLVRIEDDARLWTSEERRALLLARREMEHDRAIDILSGRRAQP